MPAVNSNPSIPKLSCDRALDQKRLGSNLEFAYSNYGGTAGMWAKLRGVTLDRAVLDVAQLLGVLSDGDHAWLLREVGEFADAAVAMQDAMDAGHFVILERPREAYWNAKKIQVDWDKDNKLWEYVWELGRCAKSGRQIDRFNFGDNSYGNIVINLKSRLTGKKQFPLGLADKIIPSGRGSQKLTLPPERIRIFQVSVGGDPTEWTP